jgi:mRNA interferase MazF
VVALGAGVVVLVRFPFSDLSSSKLRPAVVLAHAGGTDWVLCQITSNPYGDPLSVPLVRGSFVSGGLDRDSFARPGKLFTASESIAVRRAGVLASKDHRAIVGAVVNLLQAGVRLGAVQRPDAADKARSLVGGVQGRLASLKARFAADPCVGRT